MFFYCLLQEVIRIRAEHPDDNQAVFNDRVKGQLKVTRAFGAGFLKRVSCSCKFDVFKKLFLSGRTFLGSLFLWTFQHKFSYMMDMLCLCTFCTYAWLTDKVARYLKIENEMQLQGNMHILYYNFLVMCQIMIAVLNILVTWLFFPSLSVGFLNRNWSCLLCTCYPLWALSLTVLELLLVRITQALDKLHGTCMFYNVIICIWPHVGWFTLADPSLIEI